MSDRILPPSDEDLILYYYGEAADPAAIAARLAASPEAARRYAELERILASANHWAAPEPGPGFEGELWQRLAPRLDRSARGEDVPDPAAPSEPVAAPVAAPTGDARGRLLAGTRRFGPAARRWMPAAAAAALLLAAGYLVGRWSLQPGTTGPDRGAVVAGRGATPALSAEARQRILVETLADHLDRSQRLFTELVNAPTGEQAALAGERQAARELLADNRLYRTAAERGGRDGVVALLEEIEPVLLELAHLPAEPSASDVAFLRHRVESRGLLFKTRVASDLLARSLRPEPARAPRASI